MISFLLEILLIDGVSLFGRFVEILPSKGAVERMCSDFKVSMLPSIPMDPALVLACEQGRYIGSNAAVAQSGASLAIHQLTTSVMSVTQSVQLCSDHVQLFHIRNVLHLGQS